MTEELATFHRYCLKDCAVTYEINEKNQLDAQANKHYLFNVDCLNALLYMQLKGIKYDGKKAKQRLEEINQHIYQLQFMLDQEAGVGFKQEDTREFIKAKVQETLCYIRNPEQPKKGCEEAYRWCSNVLSRAPETPLQEVEIARLNTECGLGMNVKSEAFKTYLYETLALPVQKNRATKATSTDNESLLKLQKLKPTKAVELGIDIMELRTRAQALNIKADPDGRVRCGFNIVGTVTGRLSCYKSPTGSGYNLQTTPDDYKSLPESHPLRKGMRDLFLADEGYWIGQCDLKGSDGWSIGAHLSTLGDSSMLDDLHAGIKPASRICYMLRHGNNSLDGKERDEVKELLKEVKSDDTDYFYSKVGIWGMCYTMGVDLLAAQIAEASYGKINLSRKEMVAFKEAVFAGYRLNLWHDAMSRKLAKSPTLTSPSGNTRRFFGRKDEILGEALASEPQNTTTYATNLAMLNLWKDPENREGGRLKVQPLHTIHDALMIQFRKEDTAWAKVKIQEWFNNTIVIAGIPIVIPYAGAYGSSWGSLTEGEL